MVIYCCDLPKRYFLIIHRGNDDISDLLRIVTIRFLEAETYIKDALVFIEMCHRLPANSHFNHRLHILGRNTIFGHFRIMQLNP
ncbi:hypothetical protein D3C81_786560 [compost metagenome]